MNEDDRFWDKVDTSGDCWPWLAAENNWGYGLFNVGSRTDGTRRKAYAHRWSYEHLVGPIPEGLQLDHLCRTPACVRPEHLEPVTPSENVRRGHESRGTTAQHGSTSMYRNGCRCRPCTDAQSVYRCEHYARKLAEVQP